MNRTLLSLAAATAIVSAATLLPSRADAMGVGSAAAIEMALEDMSALENVRLRLPPSLLQQPPGLLVDAGPPLLSAVPVLPPLALLLIF